MLGGSVYVAFIRFVISLMGVILLFSIICESRFGRKMTVFYYLCFGMVMTALSCMWYMLNQKSYVRIGVLVMYLAFAVFSFWIGKGSVWLKIYKLVLVYYLMAVFVIGSIEISTLLFDKSIWVDIIMRIILVLLIAFLLNKYARKHMEGFGSYIEKEADQFSIAAMIVCILFGIAYILNPELNRGMSFSRIFQIFTNFLLLGILQLLIFRFYLHLGNEKRYERENQLVQMNNRLLESQLEILKDSVESGRRIRHDARHHNAVIAEYARRGQREELLQYLKEYEEEIVQSIPEMICANIAVNNILTVYSQRAEREGIKVILDVKLGNSLTIPSIDLVAILANAFENAIHACMEVKKGPDERECLIRLMMREKKNKLTFLCSNTCRTETKLTDGQPNPEFTGGIGVYSIIRTAEKYNGEYDFRNNQGVFLFRLIMNTKPVQGGEG